MGSKKRSTTAKNKGRRSADEAGTESESQAGSGSGAPPGIVGGYLGGGDDLDASLQAEARRRYLNYALSVITSRALPDVRDGLKPVQRRILYAMSHDEHLSPTAKHKKSAKVVGSVIGKYHPHGDTAVYDAMVRMAQDFSMRMPLVDGSGNFGSLDGDSPAAYRYTEARLAPPAQELLRELGQDTVAFRATYDGTATEPLVLPARFPNLLVNGCTGIAVGMATNIPPHNLRELVKALIALAENPELTTANLISDKYIKGPDFPTGGQILNDKADLRKIYEEGRGAIRVRGQYRIEPNGKTVLIIVTAVPYGVTKNTVEEKVAEVVLARKLPQVIDVRDESTTDVRLVIEAKRDADPDKIMAYLFKHTPLQLNFNVNMTALVPTQTGPEGTGQPQLLSLKEVLQHFLDFRHQVTRSRFEHELAALLARIHLLDGFILIFDALDETIRIIRKSDGKADAAGKLMKRFGLDAPQVDAILELRLYKLAKLEINIIREELDDKRSQARAIEVILGDEAKLSGVVKSELREIADTLGTPRKTKTGGEELEFDADAYILDEDADVVLTHDGWIKRLRELKDPKSTRLREGDEVMAVLPGSTKENVIFFTNHGAAYVTKINDIPASTGYGQPIQKLFKFKDGERIVNAYTLDPRAMPRDEMLAISANGMGQRFSMEPFQQPTTRAGRRFAKLDEGDEIVGVLPTSENESLIVATRESHVLSCKVAEVNKLENPGKGVTVIKVGNDDRVIGFIAGTGRGDVMHLKSESSRGTFDLSIDGRRLTARGGKGNALLKRKGSTVFVVPPPLVLTPLQNNDGSDKVH